MITLTKQDIQTAIDSAKNRIMDRMVTRQDVQSLTDASCGKVLNYVQGVQQQQFQLTRQINTQMLQFAKRVTPFESRMAGLENEVRALQQLVYQLTEAIRQQQRTMQLPIQPIPDQFLLYLLQISWQKE